MQYISHILATNNQEKKAKFASWLWWGMGGGCCNECLGSGRQSADMQSEEHDKDNEEKDADGENEVKYEEGDEYD